MFSIDIVKYLSDSSVNFQYSFFFTHLVKRTKTSSAILNETKLEQLETMAEEKRCVFLLNSEQLSFFPFKTMLTAESVSRSFQLHENLSVWFNLTSPAQYFSSPDCYSMRLCHINNETFLYRWLFCCCCYYVSSFLFSFLCVHSNCWVFTSIERSLA